MFGIGWFKIHIAGITCPVFLTLSGTSEGSQTTYLHLAVSSPDRTPTTRPSSTTISSTGLSYMYVPPYMALRLTNPCGNSPKPYKGYKYVDLP